MNIKDISLYLLTKEILIENRILSSSLKLNTNFRKIKFFIELSNELESELSCEQIYKIANDIVETPKCGCGANLKFQSYSKGFNCYCADKKCEFRKSKRIEKTKQTNIEKYGVENVFQSESAKQKSKRTKFEKYNDENFVNREKAKRTVIEKYCVKHVLQSKSTREKAKQTKLEKYNDANFNNREKAKQTNIEKYGVESHNSVESVKRNKRINNLEKYGVEYTFQLETTIQKSKQTKLEKYNDENFVNMTKAKQTKLEKYDDENFNNREKAKQTVIEKYGVEYCSQSEVISEKFKLTRWLNYYEKTSHLLNFEPLDIKKILTEDDVVQMKDCNHVLKYVDIGGPLRFRCLQCYPLNSLSSIKEKEVLIFIKANYSGVIIENDRTILKPKELDIYLPEINLAVEFNGTYWHSDKYKDKNFHLDKTNECAEKGISLFHISESDWMYKNEIIKSMLLQKLNKSTRIFARKCTIKEVQSKESSLFLKQNHLQGADDSNIKLGLYYSDELYSIMTFSKRFNKKYDYELSRFCNKLNATVIGGASKLFNYFKSKHNGNIISYADRSHSNGNLYRKLNMKQTYISDSNYLWVKGEEQLQSYTTELSNLLEQFNTELTEIENMSMNGYVKIYDSGNFVFEYNI